MYHKQYIAAMSALGYSRAEAEGLIWLSRDSSDVVLRRSNFVPRGDGLVFPRFFGHLSSALFGSGGWSLWLDVSLGSSVFVRSS
jgi:hypothetical protein